MHFILFQWIFDGAVLHRSFIISEERAKRKAPVDYGITGFDNIDTLAYVTPQLSTISNVVDEVAKSAVEMLFAMIDAEPEVEQVTGDSQRILPHRYLEGETL